MNKHTYRINVGFLINQPVGTTREFEITAPEMVLDEETTAKEIKTVVTVSKVQQGILAEVDCSGTIDLECDRCLEPFRKELKSHFEELFYFQNLRENEDAELFLPETGYMDLDELIREYLVLEIPYSPVCREDCKGLCPQCGANLNHGNCGCQTEA